MNRTLQMNYEHVLKQIDEACERAGRNREEVTLVAVSKTKPVELIKDAVELGMTVFGENKPQEIRDKVPEFDPSIEWHMIGHLQTNKIKYVLGNCTMIHSVDSIKIAQAIQGECEKRNMDVDVLVQINVADEDSKGGFSLAGGEEAIRAISKFDKLHIKGLMTIAPYVDDSEENRSIFSSLRQFFIDMKTKNIDNVSMNVLSMGMSNDYVIAIEEGATHVRVGTGIFGERNYR